MSEFLHAVTDGSECYIIGTFITAYHIPAPGIKYDERMDLVKAYTTAEVSAIRLSVTCSVCRILFALILTDSSFAHHVHLNSENASILVLQVAQACQCSEDYG